MSSNIKWLLFLLLTFIVTLPISWWGLSKADFFYSELHDSIGIDAHIQRFAPRNRFNKLEFENTTKADRVGLFHGVVNAIHNNGDGLESLAYTRVSNKEKVTLFTEAEIIHLKDVAILIEKLKPIAILLMFIWLVSMLWVLLKNIRLPTVKCFSLLALVLIGTVVLVLSIGPEQVFNQLHIWVFPDNHQWFFYYEDSLMSTMMKAPDLFAYISVIWTFLSILLTIILLRFMHLIQHSRR
jgi:hypothetical protein